jgi:multidrug efflux pump subunit AcrA (membrane-fusion protein)
MFDKSVQSFRVDAELRSAVPQLYAGLSAEANIVVAEKERALVIPRALLGNGDSVWVQTGKKAERRAVKTGLRNYQWVEILEGLNPDDALLRQTPSL